MDELTDLFVESIRLRLKGEIVHSKRLFQQYQERATTLGRFPPQHLLIHQLFFESDLSSIEEVWKSSAKALQNALAMCESDARQMDRLEILISLTQVFVYLNEAEQASFYLEQAQNLLRELKIRENSVVDPFANWSSVIFSAKREQMERLFQEVIALRYDNKQDDTWGNMEFVIIKDQEQIREELENRGIDYDEVIKQFEPHTSGEK